MNKEVYEIDDDGFIIENYLISIVEDGNLSDLPEGNIVPIDLPQPNFYKPQWDGEKWMEGATQEEIDEIIKPVPRHLSDTEILGQQMTEREIEAMVQGQQITDIELRLLGMEVANNV